MGGILDDFQIVAPRDREDAIHVAWMAGEVDRLDRLDPLMPAAFERLLDARGIDVEGAGVNIDKDRLRAEISQNLGSCGKGERRGDNFVAGTDAERP